MKKPLFSIITPFNCWIEERREQFYRAVRSIQAQTFKDFEWIVVNDGSTLEFEVPKVKWLKVINKEHGERVIAFNAGFRKAKGEWFTILDSDDEYEPYYLERVKWMIDKYPEYKMFNFGARYVHKDGEVTYREPFQPEKLEVGHEVFGGGNIVSGTFVFNRSIYDEMGAYPPDVVKDIDTTEINYGGVRDLHMNTPFDLAGWFLVTYPEQRQYFMVDHEAEPNKILKEIGNPWGQDHIIFYKYTREYHSKPVREYLYIVHPK